MVSPISGTDDYWSDDFDTTKNCQEKERIKELTQESKLDRCSTQTGKAHTLRDIFLIVNDPSNAPYIVQYDLS